MTSWAADDAGVVRLSDGRLIRGTGARRPRGQTPAPEFDVYLLGRYPRMADWPYRWVRWPDFRLPASTEDAIDALREAHARAASERVEIACEGGVGRTGTALAVLAVMSGVPADAAVVWVRTNYHPRAVETRRQRAWVTTAVASSLS
ncbi:protein-tyrosine phosphatase family protein [Salana multivorans]